MTDGNAETTTGEKPGNRRKQKQNTRNLAGNNQLTTETKKEEQDTNTANERDPWRPKLPFAIIQYR